MMLEGLPQGGVGLGRIDQRLGKSFLVFRGNPDDLDFRDRLQGGLVSGAHHEIRLSSPLKLGGAFQRGVNVERQSRFETGGGPRGHDKYSTNDTAKRRILQRQKPGAVCYSPLPTRR